MKSVSTSLTDSTQNINTIFSHSDQNDSICWLHQAEKADTFVIYTQKNEWFPVTYIKNNNHVISNLLFTIAFLAIFAFVRLRGKDLLPNLLNTLIKRKKGEIIQNEGISSNLVCFLLSLCLSFATITVCISFFAWENILTWYSLYIFGGLVMYHFLLLLIVYLLGWTFNSKATATELIINIWTFHILAGLLISPFVIALFFVKSFVIMPLLKIVMFGILLLMVVKIIRWIEILFLHRVSILYMILYLCTLEIMPLLIIYKIAAY